MKKIHWIALACSAALYFQQATAQELMAARQDATNEEVSEHLYTLSRSEAEGDRELLKKEADALSKSDKESYLNLAAWAYETILEDAEKAAAVRKNIQEKFPNGVAARDDAFKALMRDAASEETSAADFDKKYQDLLAKYPPANYPEQDQMAYHAITYNLSTRYAKEGNMSKNRELLGQLKGSEIFVPAVATTFDDLSDEKKDYSAFSPLLKEAYDAGNAARMSEDPAVKEGNNARYFEAISPIYAAALMDEKNYDEAIAITRTSLEEEHYGGYYALQNVQVLGDAYTAKGEQKNALEAYEKFIAANGKDSTVVANAKKLYQELHGASANFDTKLAELDAKSSEAYLAKYEKDMIKKEAPDFTLMDRTGKEVSLSDYKGKIVVLDFWATWCGPCIISFPGMQAAVNKYASDDEVEFLFIDTWQREENYKELVEDFITKNNYNFHVLFDEMKDRSKSVVTAYGIQGIPTKVVVDKEGFIRFQNAGAEANVDKLVKELDTKITLAKRG